MNNFQGCVCVEGLNMGQTSGPCMLSVEEMNIFKINDGDKLTFLLH